MQYVANEINRLAREYESVPHDHYVPIPAITQREITGEIYAELTNNARNVMLNNFPILTLFIPEEELQWDLYDLLSNFKAYFDGGMMHFQSRDRGLTFLKVLDSKPSLLHNPQIHAQIVQLQDLARSIHNPELDAWLQAVQQTQVLPEWVSELGGRHSRKTRKQPQARTARRTRRARRARKRTTKRRTTTTRRRA